MPGSDLLYLSNERGDVTGVVVPIDIWREISAELETHHLLKSEAMRRRLLGAMARTGGVPFD
ncbi:MAG TPA: hypothetical protein VG406_19435, partial [Isosphaeraceae bacterium]|nr:hypothetical protein [Isosphaeraceae bacterium]